MPKRRSTRKAPSAAAVRHGEFMVDTLAPDLHESGRVSTAEDVEKCGSMLIHGQRSKSYAKWLKGTLIPDLRHSMPSTASDLARCARIIGR